MASAASAPPPPASLKRIVAASLIGTTIEWYDFFLYGSAAALVFNKLFFPDSDPLVGTLLSFLTYAVGFAARPLGALVFGHYGDRLGRKKLLVAEPAADGRGDLRDRAAAHARDGRRRRARAADRAATGPGLRARRRVGRRRAAGVRARGRPAARLLGLVAADRRARRAICSRPVCCRC